MFSKIPPNKNTKQNKQKTNNSNKYKQIKNKHKSRKTELKDITTTRNTQTYVQSQVSHSL